MPWRYCIEPGCRVPAVKGPRCEPHYREAARKREVGRPSPSARGYGRSWQELRRQVLERDGYRCMIAGCTEPAAAVDHITPKSAGGADTLENTRAICVHHHATKTGRERHALRFGPPRRG